MISEDSVSSAEQEEAKEVGHQGDDHRACPGLDLEVGFCQLVVD